MRRSIYLIIVFKVQRYLLMLKIFSAFFVMVLLASSCSYNNIEDAYGNKIDECDTTVVSYALDVAPIIDMQCVTCHGSISPQAGLDLSFYEKVFAQKENIINRINRPLGDPFVMPQSGPMSSCKINTINAWVNQGALNN